MEIRESFVVPAPMAVVWDFFDDIGQVSRCVPGLQALNIVNADEYKVVIQQKLGYFSATFEVNTKREEVERFRFMRFSSVGRTVKGSVGNLRSSDRVDFVAVDDHTTRVDVLCEPALGGMLGAVGHKMILSKSRQLTEEFASALCAALGGTKEADVAPQETVTP